MARPRREDSISLQDILDRVEHRFMRMRWHELTIGALAKALDIKAPSLYYHFEGVEGLKNEVSKRAIDHFYNYLSTALKDSDPKQNFSRFAKAYRSYAHEFPLYFDCAQYGISSQNSELMSKAQNITSLAIEITANSKYKGTQKIHLLRLIRSTLNGFINTEIEGGFQLAEDVDTSFNFLIRFFKESAEI